MASFDEKSDFENDAEFNDISLNDLCIDDVSNNDVAEIDAASIKKKPGRPRKTPIREPKPRNGIVDTPSDTRHYIEFLYDNPIIFKKIWAFFKMMSVEKLHILFNKTSIQIWCVDHYKKNKIRVNIDCTKVNHYYCENELDIGLNCKDLSLIMSTIDNNYKEILILSTQNSMQKNIQIILKNDFEIDENHKIDLLGEYEKMNSNNMFLDSDYMIKFRLFGKYYKKMINDIKSFTETLTIKQDSIDDNLVYEYTQTEKNIKSFHSMKNKDRIRLVSKLDENGTFRTSFKVDYIKPISSASLSEYIEIYADENKPLMSRLLMDKETVDIRILTEIIDGRDIKV